MTPQSDILNRLLDKYENSKHLTDPGTSNRRVMLSIQRKELPGYKYEISEIRDEYHLAARELQNKGLVKLEWLDDELLLSCISLNLDLVFQAYHEAGRIHPKDRADIFVNMVETNLQNVRICWIKNWKETVCSKALEHLQVPGFCKENTAQLNDLLIALKEYDAMEETTTMRAFSSKCYHDTKHFEKNVRDLFLRIAKTYDEDLIHSCEENELGVRDQLAVLGIYARPELYELAGDCVIRTKSGEIDVGAAKDSGLGIPSTMVDDILNLDLTAINKITFIENKTNYDEYLVSEKCEDELVVYHGGFLSPHKRKLITILKESVSEGIVVQFWADIDLGGFRMFHHLQNLIPQLQPMRMSGMYVEKYHKDGLQRNETYLEKMKLILKNNDYPLFSDSISEILKYKVTIEQETFLNMGIKEEMD